MQAHVEHPILRIERTWPGPCVVLGADPTTVVKITMPPNPVVPTYLNMGPVSRRKAVTTLARVAPYAVDVHVVEVITPAGKRSYGIVGVPRSLEPRFFFDED